MLNPKYFRVSILLIAAAFLITCIEGCVSNYELTKSEKRLHLASLNVKNPNRWNKNIQNFLQLDSNNPPPQNATLFIGSSSIVGWDTKKWFSDIETINRGFGGSYVIDSVYYADQIVLPYKPKTIVFYAGDNDVADNKSPEMIFTDFKAFVIKVRKTLPNTRIIALAIKPSIDRWKYWPKMLQTNALISEYCQKQSNMYFVDVSKVMLDKSGQPRKDIFKADGLHMNETGYKLWTSMVRPLIDK
jgi:lysophospholipase L1-like esterase